MYHFIIKHRYCGLITTIDGNSITDAFRKNNKDLKYWEIMEVLYNEKV